MRGKVIQFQRFQKCSGITPAYAGKSKSSYSNLKRSRDHPRLCGEKSKSLTEKERNLRITPAYAGKRHFLTCSYFVHKDHPRLCGEKLATRQSAAAALGSPPPMRGKAIKKGPDRSCQRITPAYAGKSYHFHFQ